MYVAVAKLCVRGSLGFVCTRWPWTRVYVAALDLCVRGSLGLVYVIALDLRVRGRLGLVCTWQPRTLPHCFSFQK